MHMHMIINALEDKHNVPVSFSNPFNRKNIFQMNLPISSGDIDIMHMCSYINLSQMVGII